MIIGSLQNTERVEMLHPAFQRVFSYLKSQDLLSLPVGKIELEKEVVRINVDEVEAREKPDALLETHNKYIDIQLPLSGEETFGWQAREKLGAGRGYQEVNDFTFYDDSCSLYFTLLPGEFVVFFPEDAHAPLIGHGKMKKIVVKVRV